MSSASCFDALGIEACILHRIRAFCPTQELLSTVQDKIACHRCSPQTNSVPLDSRHHYSGFSGFLSRLHVRPRAMPNGKESLSYTKEPVRGFPPTVSAGLSVFAVTESPAGDTACCHHLLRVMRQGIGVHTNSRRVKCPDELVEHPPNEENFHEALKESERFIKGACCQFLDLEEVIDRWIEDTCYTVTEIVFESKFNVATLGNPATLCSWGGISPSSLDSGDELPRALPYLLARSYAPRQKTSLSDMIEDMLPKALHPVVRICNGQIKTENLSQSRRAFVALGPRGSIVAHERNGNDRESWPAETIVISALNMLELLRARHFNLIVAHTKADDAIRKLSVAYEKEKERKEELARSLHIHREIVEKHREQRHKELDGIHQAIVNANGVYGLVVGDPGNYLLDGSSLSRMAELAKDCFNIRALRKNTKSKMEALNRFYGIYESRLRQDSIDDYLDRLQNSLDETQLVNERLG